MAVGMQGGAPEPPALSTLRTRFSTDLETIRGRFRFPGALLTMAGALYLVPIVCAFLLGQSRRVLRATISAGALLTGGTHPVVGRYSPGLLALRRRRCMFS